MSEKIEDLEKKLSVLSEAADKSNKKIKDLENKYDVLKTAYDFESSLSPTFLSLAGGLIGHSLGKLLYPEGGIFIGFVFYSAGYVCVNSIQKKYIYN